MRHLLRLLLLAAIVALGIGLFYIGREHQIFLDNRTIEVDGQNFRALRLVRVSVNGGDPIEFMPRDRDLAKVVGPSFTFRVEVMDEFGEETEKVVEKELRLGFVKDVMLSLPLLAADRDDYILPPPTARAPAPEPEPENNDALAVPEVMPERIEP
jgi:hypothetical protein